VPSPAWPQSLADDGVVSKSTRGAAQRSPRTTKKRRSPARPHRRRQRRCSRGVPRATATLLPRRPTGDGCAAPAAPPPATAALLPRRPHRRRRRCSLGDPTGDPGLEPTPSTPPPVGRSAAAAPRSPASLWAHRRQPRGGSAEPCVSSHSSTAARRSPAPCRARRRRPGGGGALRRFALSGIPAGGALRRFALVGGGPTEPLCASHRARRLWPSGALRASLPAP
jgi:hypothetical protein